MKVAGCKLRFIRTHKSIEKNMSSFEYMNECMAHDLTVMPVDDYHHPRHIGY